MHSDWSKLVTVSHAGIQTRNTLNISLEKTTRQGLLPRSKLDRKASDNECK